MTRAEINALCERHGIVIRVKFTGGGYEAVQLGQTKRRCTCTAGNLNAARAWVAKFYGEGDRAEELPQSDQPAYTGPQTPHLYRIVRP